MQINRDFYSSKMCHFCGCKIKADEIKARGHEHRTGQYRGAARNNCNIKYYSNRYLPVVMHNLKASDGHLAIKNA